MVLFPTKPLTYLGVQIIFKAYAEMLLEIILFYYIFIFHVSG